MDQKLRQKIDDFFGKYSIQNLPKHEIIMTPGQLVTGIFYLRKGLVRMYIKSQRGDILVAHIFRPGSFFLMTWAINNTSNRYYFEAITPVETAKAPLRDVYKFMKAEPEILFEFTGRILRGLTGMITRLEDLTFDTAYQKVESLLLYFAKKFGKKTVKGIVVDFPLTHREIASWIGSARETASLEIEKLRRNGIITINKRTIIVKDMKKLEKEAQLMPEIM